MMFLLVFEFIKCLWELIGLLSDYHNIGDVTEIGTDLGDGRYSGGWRSGTDFVGDPSVIGI